MKPGANEVYRFRIEGKTLTLRQAQYARGVAIDSASAIKFVRGARVAAKSKHLDLPAIGGHANRKSGGHGSPTALNFPFATIHPVGTVNATASGEIYPLAPVNDGRKTHSAGGTSQALWWYGRDRFCRTIRP